MLNKIISIYKKNSSRDVIQFGGLNLPGFRTNQGLQNNKDYLNSGLEQINFLFDNQFLSENSKILDFGCGQGRLVNSLIYSNTNFTEYVGVDTDKKSIDWCDAHLKYSEGINFIHLPAYNARYNTNARGLALLPFENNSFDLIFLNSVFSHMLAEDIEFYLSEFNKVLKKDGYVYLTAFVEENVPDVEENPENYLEKSSGALHRVRYDKNFFFSIIEKYNFQVMAFHHRLIRRTNQSVVVLKKAVVVT